MKIEEILQEGQNSNENFGAYILLQSTKTRKFPRDRCKWHCEWHIFSRESHKTAIRDEIWRDWPHMSNENKSKYNEISKDLGG